ncbi:cache domain-containing sensor histidine kinase [Paenibacillus tarimensis]|uniref:cache domain-containing sensor histidine kinase n=1 Tax=Paenibacillus tarimensis TaxID=416012 RepID=UPI001F2CB7DA|nr:sensor histidine kinase [Paenibacillus tarimensis]MCF2945512.1 sensor histidine kinase [Paenibacillus tarimensis]
MSRKVPLLIQLIVLFSIILLFILAATSYVGYRYSAQIILNKTSQYLHESVAQLRGKLDVKLLEYDKLLQLLMFSEDIQEHLTRVGENRPTLMSGYEVERYFSRLGRYLENDVVILLNDLSGNHYSSTTTQSLPWRDEQDLADNLPWYERIAAGEGKMVWVSSLVWRNGLTSAVMGARQVNNRETLEKLGNLYAAFPVEGLERIIGQINLGKTGSILIIDSEGTVVYSSREGIHAGIPADGELLKTLVRHPDEMFTWKEDDSLSYVSSSRSEYSGWTVAAFVEAGDLFADLMKVGRSTIIIGITGVLIAILFITFFSWTFSSPIRLLAHKLQRLDKGLLTPAKTRFSNKEVHVLYESYNKMLRDLSDTVRDLSEKQISEKQAQLIAMKAQFRPHFLYNSLNTIYWTLINEGQEKTAHMVLTLSDLLRYSIQPGSELVTVEQDLKQLERYLDLSKARFGDKLHTEIKVDDAVRPSKMMKMLLQPLVENALTHGLERVKGRRWHIRISLGKQQDKLHIVVEDNGIGMTENSMSEVLAGKAAANVSETLNTGIGLTNLNQRIGLIYGSEYGVNLSRSDLGGLKVTIDIPLHFTDSGITE